MGTDEQVDVNVQRDSEVLEKKPKMVVIEKRTQQY